MVTATIPEPRRDANGVPLMTNGKPNPTGTGRYCAPLRCYCGRCPWWRPLPRIDWARVKHELREAEDRKRTRRAQRSRPTADLRSDW